MFKKSILATSVAVLLTACGSDSSSNDAPQVSTLTALDGYLANAQVYVDTNENNVWDNGVDELLGLTNSQGQFNVPNVHMDKALFVRAIQNQTTDSDRGLVTESFVLAANSGSTIASPMTDAVMSRVVQESESIDDARTMILNSFADLTDDPDLVFGDYLVDTTVTGAALKVVGEQLVDHADEATTPAIEMALISSLSENLDAEITSNNGSLPEDYYPAVTIGNDGTPTVDSNHKPMVTGTIDKKTMTLGDGFADIDVSADFSDTDSDIANYTIIEVNGLTHGLSISSSGIISGDLTTVGDFHFEIIAIDAKFAKSYPLDLNVEVKPAAANMPPEVNAAEFNRLQDDISTWSLTERHTIDNTIDVAALFDDNESDTLVYAATSTLEKDLDSGEATDFDMFWYSNGTQLGFNNGPSRSAPAETETITISASDGVNAEPTEVVFKLPEIAEFPGYSDPHFLMDSYWYWTSMEVVETNSDQQIVCNVAYFDEVESKAYMGKRFTTDVSQCAAGDTSSLDMDNPIQFERTSWGMLKSLDYANDGVSWNVHMSTADVVFLTYTDGAEGSKSRTETEVSYYEAPEMVNSVLEQAVSDDSVNPNFINKKIGLYYDDGYSRVRDIQAAIINDTAAGVISAQIRIDSYNCDILKNVYSSQLYVVGGNGIFVHPPTFEQVGQWCIARVDATDGAVLPTGIYSIDTYPANPEGGYYEPLHFSFKYE